MSYEAIFAQHDLRIVSQRSRNSNGVKVHSVRIHIMDLMNMHDIGPIEDALIAAGYVVSFKMPNRFKLSLATQ